jgi:hypothetical protein
VHPNPARGAVQFTAGAATPGSAALVYTVDGRRLARLPLDQGRATWDGRDSRGRLASPGIYLVRVEGEGSAAARFMWLNR